MARLSKNQRKQVYDLLFHGKSYKDVAVIYSNWGIKTSPAALCAFFHQAQDSTYFSANSN
jgi:hypothetical protein